MDKMLFRPGGAGGCPGQSPYPHAREYQGQSLFVGLERTPNGVRFRMPSPTQQVNLINFQTARLGIPVVQVAPWKLKDALIHPSRALQNYALRDPSQSYQSVVGRPGSSPQMIAAVHQGIVQRQWHPPTNQHRYELFETMLMCGLKTYRKKYLAIYWLHIRGDEHESTLPSPLFENDARWHAEQVLVQHLRVQLSVTNSDRLRSITIMQNASPCSSCAKMYKEELKSVMQSGVEISVVFSSFHQVSRLSCRELGHTHSFVCPLLHVDNASALRELRCADGYRDDLLGLVHSGIEISVVFSSFHWVRRLSCREQGHPHRLVSLEYHTDNARALAKLRNAGFTVRTTCYKDWERLCSGLRVPFPCYLSSQSEYKTSRRGKEDSNLKRDLEHMFYSQS